MTRTEFVKRYAARSNLDDQWAELGFIEIGSKYRLAMPCFCDSDNCKGWQMVGPDAAPDIAEELASRINRTT